MTIPTVTLNNGLKMPQLGMGVWKTSNRDAKQAVTMAIKDGYTLIDTAKQYGNEAGVGEGIQEGLKATGKSREDLFITTKVFNGDQGHQPTLDAIEGQLDALQTDYVDLLLMHWPVNGLYNATWWAMEEIYAAGKAKAIGVCNFNVERLSDLLDNGSVVPAVNQIEFNPRIHQDDVRDLCRQHNIQVEAWSPLGGGAALSNPTIQTIADAHQKTVAQVILRWELQQGLVVIPKSVHEERIIANQRVFDFTLTDNEMATISSLNTEEHAIWYDKFKWSGNPNGVDDYIDDRD
ncbi:aldo/keto reductase [Limosilactobacillus fermentum]|uniref:aldo/keto reductase n=1 Tax=Limosilactobacillus fermentum TaxID=1613 RepID=UPI000D3758F1|nr:aldo/keto reductase [Limosilactobacillus fermentum]PTS41027.1 MFS transporter [Limosilactobacillus fermentum]